MNCFTLVSVLLKGWSELDLVLPEGSALRRAVGPGLPPNQVVEFPPAEATSLPVMLWSCRNPCIVVWCQPPATLVSFRRQELLFAEMLFMGTPFLSPTEAQCSCSKGGVCLMPACESSPLATVPSKSFRCLYISPSFLLPRLHHPLASSSSLLEQSVSL